MKGISNLRRPAFIHWTWSDFRTLRGRWTTVAGYCVVGLLLSNSPVAAQSHKHSSSVQSGLDVVTLKSGRTLRGIVVGAAPAGAQAIVVSREWLQHANPELFNKSVAATNGNRKAAAEQLQGRLKKLLAKAPVEQGFIFFLRQELERAEKVLAGNELVAPEQFMWIDFSHEPVSKVFRAEPQLQRIAVWAWSEHLPNVETRDTRDLERELVKRGINATTAPPDLGDRLPPRLQDEREWSARVAIVQYTLTKPTDFQGTGDILVRTDGERKALDLAPVLNRILRSQVDSLLGSLTGNGVPVGLVQTEDWLKSAKREADGLAVPGFRATRVELKLEESRAVVETVFVAKMPKGDWETIWSHREAQDASLVRADDEARIAQDPQVKKALDTVKSLGLGADDQVRRAVRFGAATMAAQKAADAQFFEFRDRYVQRLDTPPLVWQK